MRVKEWKKEGEERKREEKVEGKWWNEWESGYEEERWYEGGWLSVKERGYERERNRNRGYVWGTVKRVEWKCEEKWKRGVKMRGNEEIR